MYKKLGGLFLIGYLAFSCSKKHIDLAGSREGYYIYDFHIYDSAPRILKDSIKLTINIDQLNDSTLTFTSYSGAFASASGEGKYNTESGVISLSEKKFKQILVDTSGIELCLANYAINYKKTQAAEELIGVTTSQPSQPSINGVDCGGGDVVLKRKKN
jgi:hypothetical protein